MLVDHRGNGARHLHKLRSIRRAGHDFSSYKKSLSGNETWKKGGEEGEIQKRYPINGCVFERSPFSRFTGKHTRIVLRASTHILTARYRFVIIIGADKGRPFVKIYRSFKTRPFSK